GHEGVASWEYIEQVKSLVKIPVILNGDVKTPEDVKRAFEAGADAVMIGRAAIANPWIFRQAKHYLATGRHLPQPNLQERIELCVEHLKLSVYYNWLRDAVIPYSKYYVAYLKGVPHVQKLRQELMRLVDLDQVIDCLRQFLAHEARDIPSTSG
ncbi:MAG: tRNA-dihydrouridine synthase, partial [Candidatus Omnitrophica bacterium]|nr:tRNA-dihydrouridine synthase [Candidatus Omnitrophota bacterium]